MNSGISLTLILNALRLVTKSTAPANRAVKRVLNRTNCSVFIPVERITLTELALRPKSRTAMDTAVTPTPGLRCATLFTNSA